MWTAALTPISIHGAQGVRHIHVVIHILRS
jgi:hypothetical protein